MMREFFIESFSYSSQVFSFFIIIIVIQLYSLNTMEQNVIFPDYGTTHNYTTAQYTGLHKV